MTANRTALTWALGLGLLFVLALPNRADIIPSRVSRVPTSGVAAENQTVPVYCGNASDGTMRCDIYDGSATPLNSVPVGKYLVVTDVSVGVSSVSQATGQLLVTLYARGQNAAADHQLSVSCQAGGVCSEHYRSPGLILFGNQSIGITSSTNMTRQPGAAAPVMRIAVNGFLTSSLDNL